MNFDYCEVYNDSCEPIKDSSVPDEYQKFLPCNLEKTKDTYPYSYSPFLIYLNENVKKATSSVYSDRLLSWDRDKYKRLSDKHLKDVRWDNADSKRIEEFLCDYFGKKIILVANIQYVNMSSGYPVWRFDYCEVK